MSRVYLDTIKNYHIYASIGIQFSDRNTIPCGIGGPDYSRFIVPYNQHVYTYSNWFGLVRLLFTLELQLFSICPSVLLCTLNLTAVEECGFLPDSRLY